MLINDQVLLRLLFGFCLIALPLELSLNVFAQTADSLKTDWYCDERLQLDLQVGTVLEITPYKKKSSAPVMANFADENSKYQTVNIIKFQMIDLYTGEPKSESEMFYNVRTGKTKAFNFAVGQKYLFETDYLRSEPQTKVSDKYAFIKPQGFLKAFDEAKTDIEFLKSVKGLKSYQEILKTDDLDVLSAENMSVRATSLIKPFYSKELKKLKLTNNVKVFVVVDETGRVIKAKAFCAKAIVLAEAAEQAALLSRFAPTLKDGKPIKVKGIISYNFKP
jgi:hypothetical protein